MKREQTCVREPWGSYIALLFRESNDKATSTVISPVRSPGQQFLCCLPTCTDLQTSWSQSCSRAGEFHPLGFQLPIGLQEQQQLKFIDILKVSIHSDTLWQIICWKINWDTLTASRGTLCHGMRLCLLILPFYISKFKTERKKLL